MDPNACYKQILADIDSYSYGDANDGLQALLDWIKKGGFPPTCFNDSDIAMQTLNALDRLLYFT